MKVITHSVLFLLLAFITRQAGAGEQWRQIAQPTTKDLVKVFFLDSVTGWAVGREGTIVKTTNGGTTWVQQNSGLSSDINDIFMLNNRIGWAISWIYYVDSTTYYGTRFLKTTNGGDGWQKQDFPVPGSYLYAMTFLDSLNGWTGGSQGEMYQTADGGKNWSRARVHSTTFENLSIRNLRFLTPNYGFGMGGQFDIAGVVWRTTNGGQDWYCDAVSPEPVHGMHYIDSLNVLGISGDFEYGASVIRTRNGGLSWEYYSLNIFGQPRAMSFRTPSEGWVSLSNSFIVTRDTGATWTVVGGIGSRQILDFVFTDSTNGFAVSDSGMIFRYERTPTRVGEVSSVPFTSRLLQNYPNPFNPTTEIRFQIAEVRGPKSEVGRVTLKVFDVLGKEVATLVHEELQAGEYSIVWNAADIPSGAYFYILYYGSFVETKKMILIR